MGVSKNKNHLQQPEKKNKINIKKIFFLFNPKTHQQM